MTRVARLALADGSVFRGAAHGASGVETAAEVVFNTSLTGYQESLTDPSYRGQILVQTTPLIGNTGVNADDTESGAVQVSGFVVREFTRRHSNYRAAGSLDAYLAAQGVLAISGVDSRAITRKIRSAGSMGGVLSDDASVSDADLVARARGAGTTEGCDIASEAGRADETEWGEPVADWSWLGTPSVNDTASDDTASDDRGCTVLALDCGAKHNILRHLASRGCRVRVIPSSTPADEILSEVHAGRADGLFVSNGPGDPAAVERVIDTLRRVISAEPVIPVFGICLGHQLLALALGARTYKLKFGHRGTNQPVVHGPSGRVSITSQNHGFAVDADSLEALDAEITHTHLNDGTVAGFRLRSRPVFSVQFHPEASPGPHDAGPLFDKFVLSMRAAEAAGAMDGTGG